VIIDRDFEFFRCFLYFVLARNVIEVLEAFSRVDKLSTIKSLLPTIFEFVKSAM